MPRNNSKSAKQYRRQEAMKRRLRNLEFYRKFIEKQNDGEGPKEVIYGGEFINTGIANRKFDIALEDVSRLGGKLRQIHISEEELDEVFTPSMA